MKITSEGQVTIPQEIREKAGLLPDTEVEFVFDGTTVTLVKKSDQAKPSRGEQLIKRLKGKGDLSLTTDEILAMTRGFSI